jgi:LmbE family N-acetylglucosaminyl deacetylase
MTSTIASPVHLRPLTLGESAGNPEHVITDAAELGTVLAVWAHPDDETLLAGGLLAAARDAGRRVVCVTATLGERGTDDPLAWPPERLGRVRSHELKASLAALGVIEHHLLGVTDGTCADQPHDMLVGRLARLMEAVQPDTVVTFGPDGLTGHEDHQTVSTWTTAARAAAAPGARLLYVTTTEEFVERWETARDAFDVFLAEGLPLRTPSSALAVRLNLRPEELDRKMVALRAQASQMSGLIAAVGEDRMREWWAVETFVSADAVADRTGGTPEWGTWRVAA